MKPYVKKVCGIFIVAQITADYIPVKEAYDTVIMNY